MTADEKVDILKPFVNYDSSSFVKETLSFPHDFYRAIEYAIRTIAKKARVFEKTFYLPIRSSTRLYNLSLTKLTTDKLEYVKTIEMGLVNIIDGEQKLGLVDQAHVGDLEVNKLIDSYALARRLNLNGIEFKSSSNTETYEDGEYNSITSIAGTTITPETPAGAGQVGYYVINLSMSNQGVYSYTTIATVPGATFTTVDDMSSKWANTDKIYIVETLVPMIVLVAWCIPILGYITSKATIVPVIDQFLDDIDPFAIAYLFRILAVRDIKQAQVYNSLVKSGLIKSEEDTLLSIRERTTNAPVTVKNYNPFGDSTSGYGR